MSNNAQIHGSQQHLLKLYSVTFCLTEITDLMIDKKKYLESGPKKRGHRLITIILSNLNKFTNFFFTGRFLSKFSVKWILNIPSHLACVATLPRETWMSEKQAINDKLQGSAVTYWRYAGDVNNQIKKGLLLSVVVDFYISEYLAKLQARAWLSHALCAPGQHTAKRRRKCTRQSYL